VVIGMGLSRSEREPWKRREVTGETFPRAVSMKSLPFTRAVRFGRGLVVTDGDAKSVVVRERGVSVAN